MECNGSGMTDVDAHYDESKDHRQDSQSIDCAYD